jgi:hypothetical protein
MSGEVTREVASLPWGIRVLSELTPASVEDRGEEARDLATLVAHGVPIAHGHLVDLAGDERASRLARAVELTAKEGGRVLVTPVFPSRAMATKYEHRAGMRVVIADAAEAGARIASFLDAVSAPDVMAALGGGLARLSARVVLVDAPGTEGQAASADPIHGDPDEIRIWESTAAPWLVDRRTTRVTSTGEGHLDVHGASTVADLADRAQLALGRPVQVGFCRSNGRFALFSVRSLLLRPSFTSTPFRIVALIASDEGTVLPMAIDALDKALREEDALHDEECVRRIYARPYRRMDESVVARPSADPISVARASVRAARVAVDVAAPVAASRRFEQSVVARLAALDAVDMAALSDDALLEHTRDRQRLVIEAFRLLDRGRVATMAVLAALEAAVGTLPRECFPALARPRITRTRRKLYDRMARLAKRVVEEHGALVPAESLSPATRKKWDEVARSLARLRPLGIDVEPLPYGESDGRLRLALAERLAEEDDERESARKKAARRLLATAREKSFGGPREAVVRSLLALLARVAGAKGRAAEGLAAALLRLREATVEMGRRLEREGIVDDPEDALYLHTAEMGQALAGEPGAYAARVRLRREDDARWARFEAPRRIDGRRKDI